MKNRAYIMTILRYLAGYQKENTDTVKIGRYSVKEVKGLLEKKSVQIWDFILHRFISWTDYPINLEKNIFSDWKQKDINAMTFQWVEQQHCLLKKKFLAKLFKILWERLGE